MSRTVIRKFDQLKVVLPPDKSGSGLPAKRHAGYRCKPALRSVAQAVSPYTTNPLRTFRFYPWPGLALLMQIADFLSY